MAKMPPGPFTKGRTGTPAFRPVAPANKLPIGNYTKGKPGTPAYRPVGAPNGPVTKGRTGTPAFRPVGTPGTKNYVPRVSNNMRPRKPGAGGMERFMSAMGSVLRTKTRKPR